MNFKLIKSKEFSFKNAQGADVKASNHIVAYKGRVFNLSTLNFEPKDFSIADGVLKLNVECDIVRENYTNGLGESQSGLKIMPKMDLVLSAF